MCHAARSTHRWREGAYGYLKQQYGQGFGRLDLVAKHRGRSRGDDVSRRLMMMHAPIMLCALGLLLTGGALALLHRPWQLAAQASGLLFALLFTERLVVGVRAAQRFGDPAGYLFGLAHSLRDLAWVVALFVWSGRRLLGHAPNPAHSMARKGRGAATAPSSRAGLAPSALPESGESPESVQAGGPMEPANRARSRRR